MDSTEVKDTENKARETNAEENQEGDSCEDSREILPEELPGESSQTSEEKETTTSKVADSSEINDFDRRKKQTNEEFDGISTSTLYTLLLIETVQIPVKLKEMFLIIEIPARGKNRNILKICD